MEKLHTAYINSGVEFPNPGGVSEQGAWQDTLLDVLQFAEGRSDVESRRLKAAVAGTLEDMYYAYRENGMGAYDMANDLNSLLADSPISSADVDATDKMHETPGKRQPGIEESVVATLERFQFIEQLEDTFGEKIDSVIVGGSMSYGPFFNVRGGDDSSDVDAIMVAGDNFLNDDEWKGVAESDILTDEDKELFLDRKRIFAKLNQNGGADILSQRFTAKDGDFNMSAHIMSKEVFNRVFVTQLENDMAVDDNVARVLRDYKSKKFERAKCDHQGFNGSTLDYTLPEQEVVEGGYIATIPAYLIDNEQYYPGLYQCLLLPSTLLAYDKSGDTSAASERFAKLVTGRLDQERQFDPSSSVLNAYPRKAILAPGRYGNE